MKSIDWNTVVLTGACVCLGIVVGILLGGAIAPPIESEPWLRSYGNVVSALVGFVGAVVGFTVATRNVLRQMRVNLMIREEDRIEGTLPGLIQAQRFVSQLGRQIVRVPTGDIIDILKESDLADVDSASATVAKRLPLCDERTKLRVLDLVNMMRSSTTAYLSRERVLEEVKSSPEEDLARIERNEKALAENLERLERNKVSLWQYGEQLKMRIGLYNSLLPRFRNEIERYFADKQNLRSSAS